MNRHKRELRSLLSGGSKKPEKMGKFYLLRKCWSSLQACQRS
jgi:hypothetical protein